MHLVAVKRFPSFSPKQSEGRIPGRQGTETWTDPVSRYCLLAGSGDPPGV